MDLLRSRASRGATAASYCFLSPCLRSQRQHQHRGQLRLGLRQLRLRHRQLRQLWLQLSDWHQLRLRVSHLLQRQR